METIVHWFYNMFFVPDIVQTIMVLFLCSGIGLLIGQFKIGKVSLGITCVFFIGILISHWGVKCNPELLSFVQCAGLTVFVYALGLEVGPSFFPSLKKQGLGLNIISFSIIILDLIFVVGFHYIMKIPIQNMLGILSGAVTNTPVLAAVQTTLIGQGGNTTEIADLASACAITYPLGVVGVILAIMVINSFKPIKKQSVEDSQHKPFICEFVVTNPQIINKTIHELVEKTHLSFIISRIWRDGTVILPKTNTTLNMNDHLLLLAHEEDIKILEENIGNRVVEHDWNKQDINWDSIDVNIVSKRIVITNSKVNGVKLSSLKLRSKYGINITRLDRAGIELLASPDLRLQMGDRLTVVGESAALSQVAKFLGDSIQVLEKPRLVGFFLGMLVGCLIGSIPFYIPGLSAPIKLGLAGGPILMGIIMGAYGARFKIVTYVSNSAIQVVKQMGIVTYLAGLGLSSGARFFEILLKGDGLLWIGIGFIITFFPIVIIGLFCTKVLKMNFGDTAGMICGTMANPMALDYAQNISVAKHCTISYASVYPIALFLRIITAQIVLLIFM